MVKSGEERVTSRNGLIHLFSLQAQYLAGPQCTEWTQAKRKAGKKRAARKSGIIFLCGFGFRSPASSEIVNIQPHEKKRGKKEHREKRRAEQKKERRELKKREAWQLEGSKKRLRKGPTGKDT